MSDGFDSQVFIPGIYNNHRSLTSEIDCLSDPKIDITPERVANMVAKYVFSYINPGMETEKVEENDINHFFQQAHKYHTKYRGKMDPSGGEFSEKYAPFQYQIGMAGDVAPTVALLMDMINLKVMKTLPDTITNVEPGTGSGILQVGRHIWARRNGKNLPQHQNIGIEASVKAAFRTKALLETLNIGTVLARNSTDVREYAFANIPKEIHFFTNENLPRNGHRLKEEPFFKNLFALFDYIGQENFSKTSFFPKISKFFFIPLKQEIIFGIRPEGELLYLKTLQKTFDDVDYHSVSLGLALGESFFHDQGTVGDEFLVGKGKNGFINFFPFWYHRWKKSEQS